MELLDRLVAFATTPDGEATPTCPGCGQPVGEPGAVCADCGSDQTRRPGR